MLGNARLQVCGFVAMNDVALDQFVDHREHLRHLLLNGRGVGALAHVAQRIPHRLVLITVAQALFFVGSDALER